MMATSNCPVCGKEIYPKSNCDGVGYCSDSYEIAIERLERLCYTRRALILNKRYIAPPVFHLLLKAIVGTLSDRQAQPEIHGIEKYEEIEELKKIILKRDNEIEKLKAKIDELGQTIVMLK